MREHDIMSAIQTGVVFIGTSYELSINRDYNRGPMMHSEMFLQVGLRFTTVRAEATFVLVLLMMQLVVDDDWAVVLEGSNVACSDYPVRRGLAEGDCEQ